MADGLILVSFQNLTVNTSRETAKFVLWYGHKLLCYVNK